MTDGVSDEAAFFKRYRNVISGMISFRRRGNGFLIFF